MRIEELDRLAFSGGHLPAELSFAEKYYFLALRALCSDYKRGLVDKARLKKEKSELYKDFENICFTERQHNEIWSRYQKAILLHDKIKKCGCEACKEFTNIMSGLPGRYGLEGL